MTSAQQLFYYRLIALWAVCEGILGGIIHGFQLPISGIFVGGCAVIIICMMGYFVPVRGAILTATLLVEIFKMMLSPQSPLPAYLAVAFQGITGELFFMNRKLYRISCILFATLALFESGVQRIITLTLIYGNNFWHALNEFISGITGSEEITNYSKYIAGGYVLLHIAAGIAIGFFAAGIPSKLNRWREQPELQFDASGKNSIESPAKKSGKIWRNSLFIIWIILLILYLQSALHIGKPWLSTDETLQILIRSFIIILTWYFLVSPVLIFFLKKWLARKQEKHQTAIGEILLLIPTTRQLIMHSWSRAGKKKWNKRFGTFIKIILVNSLVSHE